MTSGPWGTQDRRGNQPARKCALSRLLPLLPAGPGRARPRRWRLREPSSPRTGALAHPPLGTPAPGHAHTCTPAHRQLTRPASASPHTLVLDTRSLTLQHTRVHAGLTPTHAAQHPACPSVGPRSRSGVPGQRVPVSVQSWGARVAVMALSPTLLCLSSEGRGHRGGGGRDPCCSLHLGEPLCLQAPGRLPCASQGGQPCCTQGVCWGRPGALGARGPGVREAVPG